MQKCCEEKSLLAVTDDLWSHLDTRKHSVLNHSDMPYIEMGYDTPHDVCVGW